MNDPAGVLGTRVFYFSGVCMCLRVSNVCYPVKQFNYPPPLRSGLGGKDRSRFTP